MSRSLARRLAVGPVARARANALASMLNDVAEDDVAIVRAASRAREIESVEKGEAMLVLPREELVRLGWTSDELQVAIDAKKSSKFVPFYLKMTHERLVMRYRGQEPDLPSAEAVIVVPPAELPPMEPPILPPAEESPSETNG